jgi:hypothetical protein
MTSTTIMKIASPACLALTLAALGCGGTPATLLPTPSPEQGFQLNVPEFQVPAGTEIQSCYFFAVPGKAGSDVWVNRFAIAASTGTHHVNVFRVKTLVGLSGKAGDVVTSTNGTGPCFKSSNWADWPLVVNSQEGGNDVDWTLPPDVGQRFQPGELLMLQIHYVNASTQKTPAGGQASANFYFPATSPKQELGTIFATNQNIRICPGDTNRSFETHCRTPLTGATIVAANGHFHSRGIEFTMNVTDSTGNDELPAPFYTSKQWDEPPMARGLDVKVPDGGGVSWTCSYTADPSACGNPADSCCFTFGGEVETQEHCNAFIYYYPKIQDYSCF